MYASGGMDCGNELSTKNFRRIWDIAIKTGMVSIEAIPVFKYQFVNLFRRCTIYAAPVLI